MFDRNLYDAYAANGYRIVRCAGYSSKNAAPADDEKARYKAAKRTVGTAWNRQPCLAYHDAQAWLDQGGWVTAVLPDQLVGIDVDGSDHKVKQIHALCANLSVGIHRSRNGHHYIMRLTSDFPAVKASVDLMARCGLPLTYRPGGKSNIIVEPSDQPHRKWERFVSNDTIAPVPDALRPLDTNDLNAVKDALACQLAYAGRNGIIRIDEHINMSFMGWMARRLGYNEHDALDMVERCLCDRYDDASARVNYERAKALDVAQQGGALFEAVKAAGLTWIIDLCDILARAAAKAHPELRPATKLSNDQMIAYAKHYAGEKQLIFYDHAFYALDGYVYRPVRDEDIEADLFRWLDGNFTGGRLATMLKALACHCNVTTSNASRHLLLKDGSVFDLDSFQVRPRAPKEVFFNQLNVRHDPQATCPRFVQFLDEILPGLPGVVPFLQEFIGYIFTPWTRFEKALVFKGEGANGKSVLLKVIEFLVGPHNVSHVKMSQLKDRFTPAQIRNKLLNISSEVGSRDVAIDEVLKQFISGERMQAERKGKDPFEYTPIAKFLFATNNRIITTDKSGGFSRRWEYIPFRCDFYKDPELVKRVDPHLSDKLCLEGDGIFAWAMEGLRRLVARGKFDVPPCLIENTANELNDGNPVHEFACEYLFWSKDPNSKAYNHQIYDEYKKFCAMNNYKPCSNVSFFIELRRVIKGKAEDHLVRKDKKWYRNMWLREVPYDSISRSVMHQLMHEQLKQIESRTSVVEINFEEFNAPAPY